MKNLFTFTFTLTLTFTLTASAETVKTATQPWVRSYVATNHTDITGKADKTNTYTRAEADAKIVELAPAPGNYATVSNKAMTAIQEHQSLWPAVQASTNYTDAAFGVFAETGTVERARSYGTPTRWTDTTGCVWDVGLVLGTPVSGTPGAVWLYYEYWPDDDLGKAYMELNGVGWEQYVNLPEGWTSFTFNGEASKSDYSEGTMPYDVTFVRRLEVPVTNLVGRVALTNDIPDVSGYATPADVTAAIREQSLGGIWDQQLEVWWTPVMVNGALTYQATTNVNLNAEGN